jgi:hypothetical protein
MFLIFKINGEYVMAANATPASHTGDEYVSATIKDDEDFDSRYSYSLVDGIAVKGDLIPIDEEEQARLHQEYLAVKYREDRRYPPIGDQLDDLFKAGAFSTEMTAQIQATKDANPKPTGE